MILLWISVSRAPVPVFQDQKGQRGPLPNPQRSFHVVLPVAFRPSRIDEPVSTALLPVGQSGIPARDAKAGISASLGGRQLCNCLYPVLVRLCSVNPMEPLEPLEKRSRINRIGVCDDRESGAVHSRRSIGSVALLDACCPVSPPSRRASCQPVPLS